jgi:ribosomal protein L7Ae-like RNA K-turn-binding protein
MPITCNEYKEISLANVPSKEELGKTDDIADVFAKALPKKSIHIIVQCPPPQGNETRHAD